MRACVLVNGTESKSNANCKRGSRHQRVVRMHACGRMHECVRQRKALPTSVACMACIWVWDKFEKKNTHRICYIRV